MAGDETREQLAKDVLVMAANGGMPDSYWFSDTRIKRARAVLGWSAERARTWANEQGD
jgi:hypothetical protein